MDPIGRFNVTTREEHGFVVFAAVTMDLLWFTRNQKVHDGTPLDPCKSVTLIQKCHRDHLAAWAKKAGLALNIWQAPCRGFVKINSDAAIRNSFVALACICRDFQRQILWVIKNSPSYVTLFG